jgi:hypothetical protein
MTIAMVSSAAQCDIKRNTTGAILWDLGDNRTLRYVDFDASGGLSTNDTNVTKYEWDYRNRLTAVRHFVDFVSLRGNSPDSVVEDAGIRVGIWCPGIW